MRVKWYGEVEEPHLFICYVRLDLSTAPESIRWEQMSPNVNFSAKEEKEGEGEEANILSVSQSDLSIRSDQTHID